MALFEEDISQEEYDQIVHDCFNQHTPRDCNDCPAHPDRGGRCCFGDPDKFEEDDKECRLCPFQDECREEVIDAEAEHQYQRKRKSNARRRLKSGRTVNRRRRKKLDEDDLVQLGGLNKPRKRLTRDHKDEEDEEETDLEDRMLERFMKDVVWGALQGALEMALSFIRNHRWY